MGIWLEIIVGAPIVLVLAALGWRAWRQKRVAAALAIRGPNGIDEAGSRSARLLHHSQREGGARAEGVGR